MLAPKPSQATQLASARGVAAPLSLPIAPHRIQNLQPREAGLLPFPVAAGRSFCASWFGVLPLVCGWIYVWLTQAPRCNRGEQHSSGE